jgi:hypothetical protein
VSVPSQLPLCVLSVGRSGSSLATRALNLLGVHLGADSELLPPSEQNELGFWEHEEIYRINEGILEMFGGSWYRAPELPLGWVQDRRLDELRERAIQVCAALASSPAARWGFKDPRTVVLLPFWRQLVGRMDYVICVRRPQAVIRSVENTRLPGAERRATAKLWLNRNATALAETVSERRTFIFYEDWFEDAHAVVEKLATFIASEGVDDLGAVASAFRPELRRADTDETLLPEGEIPELSAMYEQLRLIAARDDPAPEVRARQARVAQVLAQGYGVRETLRKAVLESQEKAAVFRAETESLREHATALEREQRELRAELSRNQAWLDGIHGSTSWRMTAPLRAAKRRLGPTQGSRR